MSVTIHIIRHAQGPHNVVREAYWTRDPFLTAEGMQQCARVQRSFPYTLTGIISSPQRRAIQTALISFAWSIGNGVIVDLMADLQEVGDAPCCVGMDIPTIENDFGPVVNTDHLDENWFKTGLSSNPNDVAERARRARRAIREFAVGMLENEDGSTPKENLHIAVATHSLLIPHLTGDGRDHTGQVRYFANAEWRSYMFGDIYGTDNDAVLVETAESLQRRGTSRQSPVNNSNSQNSVATYTSTYKIPASSTVLPIPNTGGQTTPTTPIPATSDLLTPSPHSSRLPHTPTHPSDFEASPPKDYSPAPIPTSGNSLTPFQGYKYAVPSPLGGPEPEPWTPEYNPVPLPDPSSTSVIPPSI
ncbi:hypothetical protein K445DRAFT_26072 [Daldinia sp. EC12]|nr:hypothetical protein K445DRAFT_26072 [Daldinia sp. EC12]